MDGGNVAWRPWNRYAPYRYGLPDKAACLIYFRLSVRHHRYPAHPAMGSTRYTTSRLSVMPTLSARRLTRVLVVRNAVGVVSGRSHLATGNVGILEWSAGSVTRRPKRQRWWLAVSSQNSPESRPSGHAQPRPTRQGYRTMVGGNVRLRGNGLSRSVRHGGHSGWRPSRLLNGGYRDLQG